MYEFKASMAPLDDPDPAVRERFSAYASMLVGQVDELAAEAVKRIRAEAPQFAVEVPELAEALSAGARPSILAELIALQSGGTLPERFPEIDADGARLAARFGVPLHLAIWLYRVGHAVQWEGWFRLIEAHEADGELRRTLLVAGSRFFFAYADRMSHWLTREYMAERDRMLSSAEQRRVSLVRDLIAGRDIDPGALDYDLGLSHLGLIASGHDAAEATRALARRLDRRLLVVHSGEETWWAWLGGRRNLTEARVDGLVRWEPPDGTRFAFGIEAAGPEGFRSTHETARSADAIARTRDDPVTHYDGVVLEVLISRDPAGADGFVARELRGIDGGDLRSRRLRETLRAYFAANQNAAATAATLGVHEQTVAQRLRAVEQRTGCPVAGRRAELDVALRLRGFLRARG